MTQKKKKSHGDMIDKVFVSSDTSLMTSYKGFIQIKKKIKSVTIVSVVYKAVFCSRFRLKMCQSQN